MIITPYTEIQCTIIVHVCRSFEVLDMNIHVHVAYTLIVIDLCQADLSTIPSESSSSSCSGIKGPMPCWVAGVLVLSWTILSK